MTFDWLTESIVFTLLVCFFTYLFAYLFTILLCFRLLDSNTEWLEEEDNGDITHVIEQTASFTTSNTGAHQQQRPQGDVAMSMDPETARKDESKWYSSPISLAPVFRSYR